MTLKAILFIIFDMTIPPMFVGNNTKYTVQVKFGLTALKFPKMKFSWITLRKVNLPAQRAGLRQLPLKRAPAGWLRHPRDAGYIV